MKKKLLALSSILFIFSCATSDIISEQNENSLEKQNLKKSNLKFSIANKSIATTTVMDLNLDKFLIQPSNGGCSFNVLGVTGNSYVSTAAFGPTPISFFNYIVRGYGKPKTSMTDWKGIRFLAGNQPKTVINRGQQILVDDPFENAISIEFPFQANTTYEITLNTVIQDNIYKEQHDQYDQNNNYHGLQKSQEFPTIALELANAPEISGNNPCGGRPVLGNGLVSANYFKRQKAEITVPPSYEQKTFIFNFSITENKSALLFYFLPGKSGSVPQYIPESSFSMFLKNLKIVQKPFDPTHVVPNRTDTNPCGFIGGC